MKREIEQLKKAALPPNDQAGGSNTAPPPDPPPAKLYPPLNCDVVWVTHIDPELHKYRGPSPECFWNEQFGYLDNFYIPHIKEKMDEQEAMFNNYNDDIIKGQKLIDELTTD